MKEPGKVPPLDIDFKRSVKSSQFSQCAITDEPLYPPIVSCGLGKLYNKASILQMLLDRSSVPKSPSHIKSLKDVVQLQVELDDSGKVLWLCPITRHVMSDTYQFAYIVPCGHVFEYSALKQFGEKMCFQVSLSIAKKSISNP